MSKFSEKFMGRDFHSAFSQNSTSKLEKVQFNKELADKLREVKAKTRPPEGELTAGEDYSYYGGGEEFEESKMPVKRIERKSGEELAKLIAKVKAEQGSTTGEGELTDEERAMAESLGEGAAIDYDKELRKTLNK